jgi:hypothetical protein
LAPSEKLFTKIVPLKKRGGKYFDHAGLSPSKTKVSNSPALIDLNQYAWGQILCLVCTKAIVPPCFNHFEIAKKRQFDLFIV